MYKEFEGKNEKEATEKAIEELGLENSDFDVEVLENVKKGLFKKNVCRIRVYYGEEEEEEVPTSSPTKEEKVTYSAENEVEEKIVNFLENLIIKMGYSGKVTINQRKENKLGLNIESKDSSFIIGRKGKDLDALQLITNVFAGNLDPDLKVVVDSENYRIRREEMIVRNAYKTAEMVKRSGRSRLLDPMNPFERRLVHTALNDVDGVETKSEGEGMYKQVRIIPVKKY